MGVDVNVIQYCLAVAVCVYTISAFVWLVYRRVKLRDDAVTVVDAVPVFVLCEPRERDGHMLWTVAQIGGGLRMEHGQPEGPFYLTTTIVRWSPAWSWVQLPSGKWVAAEVSAEDFAEALERLREAIDDSCVEVNVEVRS